MSLSLRGLLAVEGKVVTASVNLQTSTAAYAAGDVVGQVLEFPGFARRKGGGGVITSLSLQETLVNAAACHLFLFRKPITGTSMPADNAAFAIADADMLNLCIGRIDITSYPATAPSNNQQASAKGIGQAYNCAPDETTLYGILVTDGTPTYALTGVQLVLQTVLE